MKTIKTKTGFVRIPDSVAALATPTERRALAAGADPAPIVAEMVRRQWTSVAAKTKRVAEGKSYGRR